MANDISNVTGTQDGSQKLGTVTVKLGGGTLSRNTADQAAGDIGHIGDFENPEATVIEDVDQKYDARFVNLGNIFDINEGTGAAPLGVFYADGLWGLWRNTDDNSIVLAVNNSGTIQTGQTLS